MCLTARETLPTTPYVRDVIKERATGHYTRFLGHSNNAVKRLRQQTLAGFSGHGPWTSDIVII